MAQPQLPNSVNPSLLRALRWAAVGAGGLVLAGVLLLAGAFVYLAPTLPTAETMHRIEFAVPLRVYTSTGGLVSQIGEERRIPVRYEEIPDIVRQAVLAAEDDRFFEHSGLDWMGVLRAAFKVLTSGSAVQGGSTITQQAARNMFLTLEKTPRRKLSEVFLTWRMERDFTKEQILSLYLNKIFFGQRSYGIAAAAETFYGRKLDELSVAQAATLAGIVQLPSRYNPISNPKAAEARRSYVLGRMLKLGYIDQATADEAAKEPVASRGFAPLVDVEANYVAELALQELVARFGEAAVNAGYKVITTLDGRLQAEANRALRLGLMEYDRRYGYRGHLGKVELPAAPSTEELDAKLDDFQAVSILQPAVVTAVTDTSAEVHVRGAGPARIRWEGLSWAAKALKNGVGAAPRKAADVVKRGDVIHVIADRHGNAQLAQLPEAQGALVALDPDDGAIISMVGGFDFHASKFNRATQARRQPGSGFKPFLYSAALEEGFTPASIILDMPVVIEDGGEENWRPENSGGDLGGPTRLREALVRSRNLVSIRILLDIGFDAAIDHAAKFGFRKESLPRYPTLALGTQVATPLEMATGFAVFANGGFKVDPYFISRIEDSSGKVVYEAKPKLACAECEQPAAQDAPVPDPDADPFAAADTPVPAWAPHIRDVEAPPELRRMARLQGGLGYLSADRLAPRVISPQNAWLMSDIMHDVAVRGTGARTQALGRDDLAGKTGTSQRSRDNWFNGFNRNLVATVWIGYDDERSLGTEGSSTAVPLWMHFMREALRATPSARLERPGGLVDLRVSPWTGTLADPLDPDAITEVFMLNHQPRLPEPGEYIFGPGPATGAGPSSPGGVPPLF